MQITQNSSIDSAAGKVFEKIREYIPATQIVKIQDAYEFAKNAHEGQLRKSGEPYFIHPLRTVEILAGLHVDKDTLMAGLLHDVPEDTRIPVVDIEKKFGEKVAYLVDGITKLSKVHYREKMEQRQIESLKKLFIHSAQDLRVILIKLADRLDNMRSLKFIANDQKRSRIARETFEIYVPIANLLGLGEIRSEMEDLCFEYLHPAEFANLSRLIEENVEERNLILDEMIRITKRELKKHKVQAKIVGRPKSYYSIYKKLQVKQVIYNVDDLIAIRVIVPTRKDCYEVLGIIHRIFKPKIGRFKDYIAVPKPNGYQSLHTTVFGLNGSIVEFQIRTQYMHLEAEYGIAAHHFYKYSSKSELSSLIKQRSNWVQRILEIQKDQKDPQNFLENLKLDIFEDRIFVFTPKGEVVDLPRGASAIDFAYTIHTDIGNHASKAEINGIAFPITGMLGNGDVVNIMADKVVSPELEWLNFAKTSLATHKIKEFLKLEPKEKKLETGRKYLQKEFDHIGKNFTTELTPKRLALLKRKLSYRTIDQILLAIAEGNLNPQTVLGGLYDLGQLQGKKHFGRKSNMQKRNYPTKVCLKIIGDNSNHQFREILRTLNALRIPIEKFSVDHPWYLGRHRCLVTITVNNYSELAGAFESLEHLEGVEKISRAFLKQKILFALTCVITAAMWLSQPFLISTLIGKYASLISNIIIYVGIGMILGLVFYLKKMAMKSYPELTKMSHYWPLLYSLTTLAFLIIFGEIYSFRLEFNWIFFIVLIVGIYTLLTASYISYRKQMKND